MKKKIPETYQLFSLSENRQFFKDRKTIKKNVHHWNYTEAKRVRRIINRVSREQYRKNGKYSFHRGLTDVLTDMVTMGEN